MDQFQGLITWVQPFFFKAWFTIGSTEINLSRLLGLLFILIAVNWLAKFVEAVIQKVFNNKLGLAITHSSVYALGRIVRYVILFLGLVVGLGYIGFDLSSLAIIGGALGVGIGFGLQNIFNNLVSGVIILLEQTLKVGDFVDLESGVMGRVSEINMRYTRVTTNDEVDLIVPNSEFINRRVINWTLSNLHRRMHVPFGVAYGTDKELVKECALKAAVQSITPLKTRKRKQTSG
ncbi:Mechanosensitive channel MscK [Nymphon striatum]|nr:Mechanosensitive channel MscK [Nymphon striatum]